MSPMEPFDWNDLLELDELLLARADAVVSMGEVFAGEHLRSVIGLRHDMDNTLEPCRELAAWEAERGYRATYFVLHDSPYWDGPELRGTLEEIAGLGHEIGIHTNALAVALETGRDPDEILDSALFRLREWGHRVAGVVAHGDPLCHQYGFVNDEMFSECARPEMGEPRREVAGVTLNPKPLSHFGLEYESLRLGRGDYLSDSGGRWNEPFENVTSRFPPQHGQLHVLMHPCWWVEAFAGVPA